MALTNFKSNVKQESGFDEEQRLMCSVPGCNKRWTVHVSGDKPKCSKHQWEKNASDYKRPIVAKPVSQTVQQWYEKENF
jgi:hypothetical protein